MIDDEGPEAPTSKNGRRTMPLSRRHRSQQTEAAVRKGVESGGLDALGLAFQLALLLCVGLSLATLIWLIFDVAGTALPYLSERGFGGFVQGRLSSSPATYGVAQGINGSLWILAIVGVVAFPLGVAAAVYLEEYANTGRFARTSRLLIRNLAGVPSVIYGIMGLAVFKELLGEPRLGPDGRLGEPAWWQFTGGPSTLSAGLTMAILVLPIVIITSSEAVRAVPTHIREAGLAIGETRWEVVRHHVLPYAAPGILTGMILSFARAIGEAAPLLMVGAATGLLGDPESLVGALQSRFTALPMVIFATLRKPASQGWAGPTAATILVLLLVLLLVNSTAIVLRNRFERQRG